MENKTMLAAALGFTFGLAVGGVTTYFTVKKTFEDRANRDISDVKKHYAMLYEKKIPGDPAVGEVSVEDGYIDETPFTAEEKQELIIEGQNVMENQGYWASIAERSAALTEPEFPPGNAFVLHGDVQGPEEDEAVVEFKTYEKIDGEPYVISRLEFEDNEAAYDQISLTYYDGDDTLCETINDARVPDIDRVIGQRNLEYFGHASDDDRVVYVRNEKFGTDYEIFKNDGEYVIEVLNLSDEDLGREPAKKKIQRMRDDD